MNSPQLINLTHVKWLITILIFLIGTNLSYGQSATKGSIKGKVITSDGEPAISVSIALRGAHNGTTSDANGNYELKNIVPGNYTIVASLIGLSTQTKEIVLKAGEVLHINFTLTENSKQLEEVVVRSKKANRFATRKSDDVAKIPLNNLENAQAYTTVSSALMAEQVVFTMDNALRNVPGASQLWASTDRAGAGVNGSTFVLRGFLINNYLKNGIPANVSSTIDNANIESVEVLKGPSATLFGTAVNSYGGLINRVTKKPFEKFGGEISYTAGSYGLNRLSADINSPLDSAKNVLFRINTSLNTQNSWQDQGVQRSLFVAPSLSYKVNDRLSFSLDGEIYRSEGTTAPIFFFNATVDQLGVSSADKLNIDYNRSYISNDLLHYSSNQNFTGQMNYKLSNNWTSKTNITVAGTDSNGPMLYFYLLPGNTQIARNVWNPVGYDHTLDIQQNFTGTFNIGTVKNRILAGVDYYSYSSDVRYLSFMGSLGGKLPPESAIGDLFDVINSNGNIPGYYNFNKAKVDSAYTNSPANPFQYNYINKTYTTSAYFSDVINVTDNLIANVALRVDHFKNNGSYNPVNGTTTGGFSQTKLSPKFGLIYQVIKDRVSLFGNYQNGFTNKNGQDFSGRSFKPEEANQSEGGVKLDVFDGKLTGTFSYYNIKVTDIVRQDIDHPNFSIQNGTQRSKGFEAEIIANPFTGLNIVAGYAHNNGKYTNADPDINGRRPGSSGPADLANLWISYRFTQGSVKGLGAGFGGNYAGVNLIQSSKNAGDFTAPAYTLLNTSVFYDKPGFRVALKVDNLTNKRYWIGWSTVNPQQLRSIAGSVTFKF